MADDIRPANQVSRAQASLTGGPTVAAAYIVSGGTGGRWLIDTTGPAEAYWNNTGTGGRYEIDSGAASHDAFFRRINTRDRVK